MQETENKQAGMERETKTEKKKKAFSARRAALMAAFVALAYVVSLLDFPIFPATPFLKLDFGNAFILLIGFLLGPVEGVIVCVLKELLRMLGSGSAGVGEIANICATTAYILLPTIAYKFKKGLKTVVPCLIAACFIGTGAALLTNRFITFPLYMGDSAAAVFQETFWFIVAFNLIKTAAVSIVTLFLYKRLSNFLKKRKF